MTTTSGSLFAEHALLPSGWARDVLLVWNDAGVLTEVRSDAYQGAANGAAQNTTDADDTADLPLAQAQRASGPLVAGMPNLHSHAFQRAFAGLTEFRSTTAQGASDSFWTWRDAMYRFALAVSPDQLEAIATQLYIEMLQAGYTSVCEFHYLHHTPAGTPYDNVAEMALRLAAAAERTGIGITMLPVLYQDAGFGGKPPRDDQRRFINSVDSLLEIVLRCASHGVRVGVAPHSLRAVSPHALSDLLEGLDEIDASAPIHMHIAEQQDEVDACLHWSGARPVQWLLDNAAVNERWCLVHATHTTTIEAQRLAARAAVAGLCPSTEANLGDGVFDAPTYFESHGRWGIGSDSHVSVNAVDELRLLEYGQRLTLQRRNVLTSAAQPTLAERLWREAAAGGAQAAGQAAGRLEIGHRADFVVLDSEGVHAGLTPSQLLANAVFAQTGQRVVRDVWVGGRQRIASGAHVLAGSARAGFVSARSQLIASS